MKNKISRYEQREGVREIIYTELREWKPLETFTPPNDNQSVLLQSKKYPQIGVWMYLRHTGTALDVYFMNGNTIIIDASAVCVCHSCWPSVEIIAGDVYRKAISKGITHIITRHSDNEFMMHEPTKELCSLFGWGYDPRYSKCLGVKLK